MEKAAFLLDNLEFKCSASLLESCILFWDCSQCGCSCIQRANPLTHTVSLTYSTVEPPNKRQYKFSYYVLHWEVALFWEITVQDPALVMCIHSHCTGVHVAKLDSRCSLSLAHRISLKKLWLYSENTYRIYKITCIFHPHNQAIMAGQLMCVTW